MRGKAVERRSATVNAGVLTLRTRDGKLANVDARRLKDFGTFSKMLEALGSHENFSAPLHVDIDASVLNDVLHWGNICTGLSFYRYTAFRPSSTFNKTFSMTTAQRIFFRRSPRGLRNLILASLYLDIPSLYFVACFVVANRLLTIPSEIRAFFDARCSSSRRSWVPTEAVRGILFFADRAAVDRCADASQRCREVYKIHCTSEQLLIFRRAVLSMMRTLS